MKRGIRVIYLIIAILLSLASCTPHTADEFDIETVKAPTDYDNDGIDDYTDIMLGARKDAENHPTYDGRYWETGYPPDDIGVCTDVVWRAFRDAGYSLREMVNNDIIARPEDYYNVETRDKNIDFRRVKNLRVFFDEHAVGLTTDIDEIEEWQPGDIVIFDNNRHIGIVSDKRNANGRAYIIHNGGQRNREEDYLGRSDVVAHYRFDASLLPKEFLIPWGENE